jgi:maltoporin
MDLPVQFAGIRGLKITLVAGLALLTTDALFAQSADQSSVDSLKTQMDQMQRQYEQRIEAMEAKMKALESSANSGSILNTRVLTDADGKAVAPAPLLDESFIKSLTRNFVFSVYIRSGVGFNGNGGPQDFDFEIPDFGLGRFRLGNENDTYMELTWKQAHLLGDSPDVMDASMTFTPAITYNTTKVTFSNQFVNGAQWAMRQAYLEAKNFIKSAPDVTVWGGQRFYDRHDIHMHDLYFDDYSGYGLGFDNIDLGFGKLLISYLGGIRDDIAAGYTSSAVVGNNVAEDTTISDPRRSGLYMHTIDARIHDIDLFGGKLELIGDYQFLKGGIYHFSNNVNNSMPPLNIGDTSGGRGGFIYTHPFGVSAPPAPPPPSLTKEGKGTEGKAVAPPPPPPAPTIAPSFWQIAFLGGYGASENFGPDPLNQKGTLGGYNLNNNLERINSDGTVNSSPRNASQMRAIGQTVWNVTDNFSFQAEVHWRYDDQGALAAETVNAATGLSAGISSPGSIVRETGGSSWVVGGGIRPVFWLTDWFALQGQAGVEYVHNNRNGGQAVNPNGSLRNDAFGHSGAMGIFTFAPTIKPKGGYFTRPEFRAFMTYAIWAKDLEGSIGGTPYQNSREGWVFGVQSEWFF